MTESTLRRVDRFENAGRTLLLVILDGIGLGVEDEGNAVAAAHSPHLDALLENCPRIALKAHGTAVGLPSDEDMGNSEVGHNALGAGRVFDQGAKLINAALADGSLFTGKTWTDLVARVRERSGTLHFIGLLSDGNVHSHIDHLLALLSQAAAEGVERARVHTLLDGRDVPETSALIYVERLEAVLEEINAGGKNDYRIASGGGRMVTTMDRYEADWRIVERGWRTHVQGEAAGFPSATKAIEALRAETKANDQFLPPFVILDEQGAPVGPIRDGDAVIFFNFRGDRAIEISKAFEADTFSHFERSPRPDVAYAGMMQYDGDTLTPKNFLVAPPRMSKTLGEYMARAGLRQLAVAETQKFGHVTYFWNGNRTDKFDAALETYIEIPSDQVPFEERPWMKVAEVWDATAAEASSHYDFIRINFANGDMVGHSGKFDAAVLAVAAVDLTLGRIIRWAEKEGVILVVTADHGNAEQMFQKDRKSGAFLLDPATGAPAPLTAHTLNPVPFLIHDPLRSERYRFKDDLACPGLANVAATLLDLLGFETPPQFEATLLK